MNVEVFIISRYDEKERPYVSTTCPTEERRLALEKSGYQVHTVDIAVPTISDFITRLDDESASRL